jgi:hypothetical protein
MLTIGKIQETDFISSVYRFSDEITKIEDRNPTDIELRMLGEIEKMGRVITILKRELTFRNSQINYLHERNDDYNKRIADLGRALTVAEMKIKSLQAGGGEKVEEKTTKKKSTSPL